LHLAFRLSRNMHVAMAASMDSILHCHHQSVRSQILEIVTYMHHAAPPEPRVRLFGSNSPSSGLLEVYRNGTWAAVPLSVMPSWGSEVVCQELGYARGFGYYGCIFASFGHGPWVSLTCGNARLASIADCQMSNFGYSYPGCGYHTNIVCTNLPQGTIEPDTHILLGGGS